MNMAQQKPAHTLIIRPTAEDLKVAGMHFNLNDKKQNNIFCNVCLRTMVPAISVTRVRISAQPELINQTGEGRVKKLK